VLPRQAHGGEFANLIVRPRTCQIIWRNALEHRHIM